MLTIQASKFKARCLALIDEVARTGQTIVVTKYGNPIVELRIYCPPRANSLIGLHEGQIRVTGPIVSPPDTLQWNAMK